MIRMLSKPPYNGLLPGIAGSDTESELIPQLRFAAVMEFLRPSLVGSLSSFP